MELEICCGDIRSIENAAAGGARRVELCAGLAEGGVTPHLSMIRLAAAFGIPSINILVRPRGGDFNYNEAEIQSMISDIKDCREAGATGIVTGALNPDGDLDMPAMKRLKEASEGMEFVFHRAFDVCRDREATLEQLVEMGCDRILTSGGASSAEKGCEELQRIAKQAAGRIAIMAGSGVNTSNAEKIMATGVDAIHSTSRSMLPSAMKFHNPDVYMGVPGSDEYHLPLTDTELVKQLIRLTSEWQS